MVRWKRRNRVDDKRKRPRSSLEFKYGSLFKVSDIEPVFDKKQDKYGHLQMSATWLPAGGSMSVSVVPVSYEAVSKRKSFFDKVQYRIEIRRGSDALTRMVRVDMVDSMLFEPLSHLRWKPSSKRSRHSYTDGEIWDFSFSYRDTCISLGGHCFYPDKYHVVWDGIVRILLYLVTYGFQPMNKNIFDDMSYLSWVLACKYARKDAWKDISHATLHRSVSFKMQRVRWYFKQCVRGIFGCSKCDAHRYCLMRKRKMDNSSGG